MEWLSTSHITAAGAALLRIAVLAVAAWVLVRVVHRVLERIRREWLRATIAVETRAAQRSSLSPAHREELEKRSITVMRLARQVIAALITTVALLSIADQAGFEIRALLGAAGILSLAIGFGARNLVQDLITGLFMLIEDQIREGDVVRLGGVSGLVEEITLRHVRLRSGDGVVHIVPNSRISQVSNLTHQFSYFVWDLRLSYHADLDRVAELLLDLGRELRSDPELGHDIIDDLEILGVDAFHAWGPVLKMRIKTLPRRQWAVGRAFNRLIKQRFDAEGIPFPLPAARLYPGAGEIPAMPGREHWKRQVRAMLVSDPALFETHPLH